MNSKMALPLLPQFQKVSYDTRGRIDTIIENSLSNYLGNIELDRKVAAKI